MSLRVVPITLAEANRYVRLHHRHHKPTVGHIFSVAVAEGDDVRGVVMRGIQGPRRMAQRSQNRRLAESNRWSIPPAFDGRKAGFCRGLAGSAAPVAPEEATPTGRQQQESAASGPPDGEEKP